MMIALTAALKAGKVAQDRTKYNVGLGSELMDGYKLLLRELLNSGLGKGNCFAT